MQHRGKRANADNEYKKFYPVEYLAEEDTMPFGPLYNSAMEAGFDSNEALIQVSACGVMVQYSCGIRSPLQERGGVVWGLGYN